MANLTYLAFVLAVALVSITIGFRRGITHQLASLLGFAFGAVAARILAPHFTPAFIWTGHLSLAPEFTIFTANLVCAVVIYIIVYSLFMILNPLLRSAMSVFEVGMFNRILGAFFSLTKNLLWLSIFFNLLLCCSANSGLLRYERANDGNLIAAVMAITPAILGCYGAEDFAHFFQLREAKTISCNFLEDIKYNCHQEIFDFTNSRNFTRETDVILIENKLLIC